MKLGFVGLGQMGTGMVRNLLRAGHEVAVYNRSREKAEALKSEGVIVADSPAAAAKGVQAVLSMLADDKAVEALALGEQGIAAGLADSCIHVSCSTISVAMARTLEAEHQRKGQQFVSCPVFGRPDAAEAKKLVVAAGGKADVIEKVRPVLEAMGRAVFVAGPEPWQANLMKLCGNFMLMSMVESFGEAFATLRKAGADHRVFFETINEVFASPVYKNYGSMIVNETFEPAAFPLQLGFKDLRFVLEAAQEFNAPMPIASALRDQYLSAMANGQAEADWSSLALVPARHAGLKSVQK